MSHFDRARVLNTFSSKELKEICKDNDLKGYSSLSKQNLIDFVLQNLSDEIVKEILIAKGIISEDEVTDEKVLSSMNKLRKVDDRRYLTYIMQSLNVKELKVVCKEYYLEECSRHTKKKDLIEYIIDSLSEEEHRRVLYNYELKVISKELDLALKKINGEDRESVAEINIVNPENHEVEISFKGWNWDTKSYISITPGNINDPERDCDCRIGSNMGFCSHFWVGVILSLKENFFQLSDWTLTKLPDNFKELIEPIQLSTSGIGRGQPRAAKLVDESSDSTILTKFIDKPITIYKGEISEIEERQSEFQDHISVFYHVTLSNIRIGPRIYRNIDFKEEDIVEVDKLKLRISQNLQTENDLKINDKISVNGKLEKDSFWGIIVKNIRKVQKL
ncbi:MAG: Rho termination factor N-terminal domain-containing protein [Promethearchaeota archaeon]